VLKMLRGWKICENHLKESEPSQAVGDRFKRLNIFWRCKNGPFRTLLWTLLKNHDLQTNSQTAGRNLKLLEPPVMWIDETSLQVAEPHPNPSSINQLPKKTLPFWSSIGLASLLEVAEDGFEASPAKVLSSILSEPYWKTRNPQTNIIN
jgi:hypothetical protein